MSGRGETYSDGIDKKEKRIRLFGEASKKLKTKELEGTGQPGRCEGS